MLLSHRERLKSPCPDCGQGPEWILKKMIASNGGIRYPYVCKHCDARTQVFEKKAIAERQTYRDEDVIRMPQKDSPF